MFADKFLIFNCLFFCENLSIMSEVLSVDEELINNTSFGRSNWVLIEF